jgi:hypothetical protein
MRADAAGNNFISEGFAANRGLSGVRSNKTGALLNQSFILEKFVRDIFHVAMLAIERVV